MHPDFQANKQIVLNYLAARDSADATSVASVPILFFVRFFKHHGLLQLRDRPQWRTLVGGSHSYLEPLSRPFRDHIRLDCGVQRIVRSDEGVRVCSERFGEEQFDHVVIAAHSDQALGMLADPSVEERDILGAIPYQNNSVVLHTDTRVLPSLKSTWSSWNYRLPAEAQTWPVLSYDMNILQCIDSSHTFCVTLNHDASIDPARILGRYNYAHPQFSPQGIAAQNRWTEINGVRNTWFCGAYWGNGFHEDGVVSALRVSNAINNPAVSGTTAG